MKTKLFLSVLFTFVFCLLSSQVPQGFNYQAIARDGTGAVLVSQLLPVRITIQTSLTGGTKIWEETHSVTTNQFGIMTLVIGDGTRTGGSVTLFSDINWAAQTLFLKTEIQYPGPGYTEMGTTQLWSVPYSLVAKNLGGPVDKLGVKGTTSDMEEALFEVKNKGGQTVFAVYNEGVRVYVDDGDAKGAKGGFAIGGFDKTKGVNEEYLRVTRDSTRIYINDTGTKTRKGGFAIGGFDITKGNSQEYFMVNPDSIRAYIDTNPVKTKKGGFAIGGFDMNKNSEKEYLRVTSDSVKVSKSLLIPRLTIEERDNLPFTPGEALIIFNTTEGCMQIYKNNVWSNIWCFNCAPDFIIQPVDKTICSSENAVFFVSATGTNLNYQWQESPDNGTTWNNISNGGSTPAYSGARTYTLSLTNVPIGYHNKKYRCVVAGSCLPNVTSNSVTLNVGSTPAVISSQPADQQLSDECSASFSIQSPGYITSYKWQQSSNGGSTWSNISDGGTSPVFSGSSSANLSLTNVPSANNNYKYRCNVSNLCGTDATSAAATLTINSSPAITIQPSDKSIYAGQNTSFSITTSGTGYSFQWQVSINGGSSWTNVNNGGSNPTYAGANTNNLSLSNVPWACNSYKYRCVVSHFCRPGATSDAATLTVPSVSDVDGNTYNTIGIGTQIWMAENLKTTKYKDNTSIPLVTDNTAWAAITISPAYCWYNNDATANKNVYGGLYNWYAVSTTKLCPLGWHVPTDAEWTTLANYLGGTTIAGGKLKESGTNHWTSPNTGATNEAGFTALPGGYREATGGTFLNIGLIGYWWSSTEYNFVSAVPIYLINSDIYIGIGSYRDKKFGQSVRCVKDN